MNNIKNRWLLLKNRIAARPALYVAGLVIVVDIAYFYFSYRSDRYKYSRLLSKIMADVITVPIPSFLRQPIYKWYGNKYGVDFDDMVRPLKQYKSMEQFFTREVKPRNIDNTKQLVVPADSRVLAVEDVVEDKMFIVKGVEYSLGEFMTGYPVVMTKEEIQLMKKNPHNKLQQVIFYLSPGDYHRFHSPANFEVVTVQEQGYSSMSVNEESLKKEGGKVYNKNCRVLMEGKYPGGYMLVGLVGAMGVSKIFIKQQNKFEIGQELGMFKLGSTIVMIVETAPDKVLPLKYGQKVRYGDVIC